MTAAGEPQLQPCPLCRYKPTPDLPAGSNRLYECSHVECPNRHPITAAPSDRTPRTTP